MSGKIGVFSHEKVFSLLVVKEIQIKPKSIFIIYSSEQLKLKKLTISNVKKNVKKLAYIFDRKVNGIILATVFYFTFSYSGDFVIVSY